MTQAKQQKYVPAGVPRDAASLPAYLTDELTRLASYLNSTPQMQGVFVAVHAAPDKVVDGELLLADGTDWNPAGTGRWFVYWDSVASKWKALNDTTNLRYPDGSFVFNSLELDHLSSGQTAYNTGIGFFLEYNAGTPRVSVGNPAGSHWTWDGTAFKIYNSSNTLVFDSTHLLYSDGTTTIDSVKPAEAGADVTGTHTSNNTNNVSTAPATTVVKQVSAGKVNLLPATVHTRLSLL